MLPRALLAILLSACAETPLADGGADASMDDGGMPLEDAGMPESGIAPVGALGGERAGIDGDNPAADGDLIRVDVQPNEHVTFFFSFTPADAGAVLEVLRWDGADAVLLGMTDAGPGLRTLAVFDPSGPRTFWARVASDVPGTLTITRVPFEDGRLCASDCAHLLQLPLPNDAGDGYVITPSAILRYQYGRRDLLMMLRHAGQAMVRAGLAPFAPHDLSQWNGETPGTDTGSLRHVSHQRGKDVDLSLYGLDGRSEFRSYCEVSGTECAAGTIMNYDGDANARFFADFYESGRVTMCFLDRELIEATIPAAGAAGEAGIIPTEIVPLFSDGSHLQHWPNHHNHIHVRVSEDGSAFGLRPFGPPAFEPP